MDSACILACDIEQNCSQYDENLFGDHGCSSPCSYQWLLSALGCSWLRLRLRPRLRLRLMLRLRLRLRLRPRLRLEGEGVGSAITTLDNKACEGRVW